jgi:hypothetical protein
MLHNRRATVCFPQAMQRTIRVALFVLAVTNVGWAQTLPPLPTAVSNVAVASGTIRGVPHLFAALGIDSTRRWSGITTRAFVWSTATARWQSLPNVPGPVGRLAATAQVIRNRLFVIGGYTVDSLGNEHSVPHVNIYDPATNAWTLGADTPVAVDDAVSGVYRDSLLYVISGWHETDNVQAVQVYDAVQNAWHVGTPIPGRGVFGHTGGMSGHTLVFIDGAVRQDSAVKYRLEPQVWIGTVNARQPTQISWRAGPPHPGPALYRAGAVACGAQIVFAGGTDNPYNYDGVGYDRKPAEPIAQVMAFDTRRGQWRLRAPMPNATMDLRGLVRIGNRAWTVGGMEVGQRVSHRVTPVTLPECAR